MKFSLARQVLLAAIFSATMWVAAHAQDTPSDYILGPGDVLSITNGDQSVERVAVLPDGRVVTKLAGPVEAAGLSICEFASVLNDKEKKQVGALSVKVSLEFARKTKVYLLGQVVHQGLYSPPEEPAATVSSGVKARKNFTLSTLLEVSGGLSDNADMRHIHVTRLNPKAVIDVDLWKLMFEGDTQQDLVLKSGDVVYIPKSDATDGATHETGKVTAAPNQIRVMGAVNSPGLFSIPESGMDLAEVVARAGGIKEGPLRSIIRARVGSDGHVTTERIPFRKAEGFNYRLKAGDILIVKAGANAEKVDLQGVKQYPGLPRYVGDFGPSYLFKLKNHDP